MRKTLNKLWKITLLCCFSACLCAQDSGYWCNRVNVHVEPSALPIRIHDLIFASNRSDPLQSESWAGMNVVNEEAKAVRHYLILVEFFDKEGKYLLTIPFFTEDDKTGETPFPITFKRWLYGHSNSAVSPLNPSSEEVLFGDSPTLAFACPAVARIALASLQYVDGSSFSYASPTLTLDPTIAWAPISGLSLSRWLPTFATIRLAVDANGNAKLVDIEPASLFPVLEKQIPSWKLSPPLVNGKASSAELTLFLYIEDVGSDRIFTPAPPEFSSRMSLLKEGGAQTLIAAHAYRATPAAKRWIVIAGGHWVENLDERRR